MEPPFSIQADGIDQEPSINPSSRPVAEFNCVRCGVKFPRPTALWFQRNGERGQCLKGRLCELPHGHIRTWKDLRMNSLHRIEGSASLTSYHTG